MKKELYLIDYGLSSNPKKLTPIEKLYLEYHQDQFQFLWNLVFLSNRQMNNYEPWKYVADSSGAPRNIGKKHYSFVSDGKEKSYPRLFGLFSPKRFEKNKNKTRKNYI